MSTTDYIYGPRLVPLVTQVPRVADYLDAAGALTIGHLADLTMTLTALMVAIERNPS